MQGYTMNMRTLFSQLSTSIPPPLPPSYNRDKSYARTQLEVHYYYLINNNFNESFLGGI